MTRRPTCGAAGGGEPPAAAAEQRLSGLGVSPGIAIGPAYLVEGGDLPGPREPHSRDRDRGRARAFRRGGRGLAEAAAQAQDQSLGPARNPPPRRSATCSTPMSRCCRTRAWCAAPASASAASASTPSAPSSSRSTRSPRSFAAMRDPYLAARAEDIRVVGTRLIRNLIKKPYAAYSGVPEGAVILADELTPADTALMDPQRIAGFAAQSGGADSHTAIVARALGLPAVLAVPDLIEHARSEATVVIDGGEGMVDHRPDAGNRRRLRGAARRADPRAALSDAAAPAAGGDPRRGRDHPRSQSRIADRARAGDRQRGDGPRPRALRIPLHEPRRPAGRGRAVRRVLGPGARHGAASR